VQFDLLVLSIHGHWCEGKLITETEEKANILNQQFQSALTNETDLNIPDKGPSSHPHLYTSVKQGSINC
jgi:hypothetical protein